MQLLDEFAKKANLTKRTLYRHIAAGNLKTVKLNGQTYVVEHKLKPAQKLSGKQRIELIKEIKEKLDNLIYLGDSECPKEAIEQIQTEINSYRLMGITFKGYDNAVKCDVTGYSEKSLYRKITDKKKVKPKSRADKGAIRNQKIAKLLYTKIMPVAVHIYFRNSKANLKDTIDRLIEFSKTEEDFYDVAALEKYKTTLYKTLSREFKDLGIRAKHEYLNHYNLYFTKRRATNTGAFTDDINFMDYILGDDNKRNVASAWVYNPKTRQNELKQIKSWTWVEAKTGKVLSFINSYNELNTEDVIFTLIEALQVYGLPKKGLIIDQGIGSSQGFKTFIDRINIGLELTGEKKISLRLGRPYHPTDKAIIERSFGWTKDEHDSFYDNFVGDNHKLEGRHKGNALTPEKANYTFKDYDDSFRNFIYGYYENRKRRRVINKHTEEISIRDYFNREWEKHTFNSIPERIIRFALQKEREFTYKGGAFTFSFNGIIGDYIPANYYQAMPLGFYGRRMKALYNPMDLTEVDIYAMEDIPDKSEGLFIFKGEYICTLKSVRELGKEKQRLVAMHNKALGKLTRKLQIELTPGDVNSVINSKGRLVDATAKVQKKIGEILREEKPLEKIALRAVDEVNKQAGYEKKLTIEDLTELTTQLKKEKSV